MKFWIAILIPFSLGCYKKNSEIEAIGVQDIRFKTTLKNHTPGADYIINKTLEVSKELIIEEGVEIIFEEACGISIRDSGIIKINGSSQNPVKLRNKNESGRWKGIHISSPLDNQFKHVEINGAGLLGDNNAAVEISSTGQLTMEACKISDNGNASAVLIAENAICSLNSCVLSGNYFPIQMDLYAKVQLAKCIFDGNQYNMIKVRNQDGNSLVAYRMLNIKNYGLPYFYTSSLLVSEYMVSIDAGTTLLFDRGQGINTISSKINALMLQVNGSSTKPVFFGSFHSGPNDRWRGITLTGGMHKFHYATFDYAYTGNKNIGTLSNYGYANIDCKYNTFFAVEDACNISIFGKYVVYNADIITNNTYKNSKKPCISQ